VRSLERASAARRFPLLIRCSSTHYLHVSRRISSIFRPLTPRPLNGERISSAASTPARCDSGAAFHVRRCQRPVPVDVNGSMLAIWLALGPAGADAPRHESFPTFIACRELNPSRATVTISSISQRDHIRWHEVNDTPMCTAIHAPAHDDTRAFHAVCTGKAPTRLVTDHLNRKDHPAALLPLHAMILQRTCQRTHISDNTRCVPALSSAKIFRVSTRRAQRVARNCVMRTTDVFA